MAAAKGKTVVRYCEARTRAGGKCKRPAGWGTGHAGRGRCVKHGGKTPNHEKKNAREAAYDFVVGQMGYLENIDPLEAAILAVKIAAGAVAYWRVQMGECYERGETPTAAMLEGYRVAMVDLGRMADTASKAGVAERLIAITERMAEQISLAFEEALAGEKLEAEIRARIVARFGASLLKLEAPGDELPLLEVAA